MGNERMRPSFETREDALLKVTGRMHGHTQTIQRAAKRGDVVILNRTRFANFNH
jgi:thymidylate kinase